MDRKPIYVFTITGKKVITAATSMIGIILNPNHMTNRGAIATIGVTFTSKATGYRLRSKILDSPIKIAVAIAKVDPMINPATASISVIPPLVTKLGKLL